MVAHARSLAAPQVKALPDSLPRAPGSTGTSAPRGADAARAIPPRGPEQVGKAFAGFPADGKFTWGPIDGLAMASRDGGLGFTIGEARIAATPADVSYSKYLTVWRRERDGSYRFIFDIGSARSAPAK